MKKYYSLILVLILYLPSSFADELLRQKVKNANDEYLRTNFLQACYGYSDEDGIFLHGANGFRSLEHAQKLQANEQLVVASLTKNITAAAILKLQERKLLNVQDVIAKYLDKASGIWQNNVVPDWAKEITIHHLLLHRSGLSEYFMHAKLETSLPLNEIIRQIANYAASKKVKFQPGSSYEYNNTNYILLGLIIEKISGQSAHDFFNKEFFIPLNMKDTKILSLKKALAHQIAPSCEAHSSELPSRYFLTPTGDQPKFTLVENQSKFKMIPFTDGGVISTTKDLLIWHRALHTGKVLSANSYQQMITGYHDLPVNSAFKTKLGYGLHISELDQAGEVLMYHHPGNAVALRSESGYIPKKNLAFVVLSNAMTFIPKELENKIDLTKARNKLDVRYYVKHILQAL